MGTPDVIGPTVIESLQERSPVAWATVGFAVLILMFPPGTGGDRTGDMAGLGAIFAYLIWMLLSALGLVLTAASFLLREKRRLFSLAGLLPIVLLIGGISYARYQERERLQQADALRLREEAECAAALQRFRDHPPLLEQIVWDRAGNANRCAMQRLLSGSEPVEPDLLSRLYAQDLLLRLAILQRPDLTREFLEERFPQALEEALSGQQAAALERMVYHPQFPDELLKQIALDEAVPEAPLRAARARFRKQAGMTEGQVFMAAEADRTGDKQSRVPNDVLPPITPWVERERRRLNLQP